MQHLNQGNNEQIGRGLIANADGFLALTFTQSKQFKTRAAAVKWLAKRGVVVAEDPPENSMTKAEMMKRGADHCKAGKQLTPYDCQDVDTEIFAEANRAAAGVTDYWTRSAIKARIYRRLRGAFNAGWQIEYFASVA